MTVYFNRSIAVILGLIVLYAIWDYPYARVFLFAAGLAYAVYLLKRNVMAWLFVLPALLPISDLTLYSGRLYFSEFDCLILISLGCLYYTRSTYCLPIALSRKTAVIALLALSFTLSTVILLSAFTTITINSFSNFTNHYNALRVLKGFFWAWLLSPFLYRYFQLEPEKTQKYLITGLVTGMILTSISVFWERGILSALFPFNGIYNLASYLLDFTTSYRITGQFSTMRVGGTAIDGYLILVIPFCLSAFWYTKSAKIHIISLMCFFLGLYTIMVTFSRGLYAGILISMLILLSIYLYQKPPRLQRRTLLLFIIIFCMLTAGQVLLYKYGGNEAMLASFFLTGASMLCALLFKKRSKVLLFSLLSAIIFIGFYILYDALTDSKWSDNSPLFSFSIAIFVSLILPLLIFSSTPYAESKDTLNKGITFFLTCAIIWFAVIPSLTGERMTTRLSTVQNDLQGRYDHWVRTIGYMDHNPSSKVLGMGVGSFPFYYFINNLDSEQIVSFQYFQEPDGSYLQFGHGDFHIIQKTSATPHTEYRVKFKARSKNKDFSGALMLCEKHILFSERFSPSCIKSNWHGVRGEEWTSFEKTINTDNIGSHGFLSWPVTFMLYNTKSGALIDITDIEILNPKGENLISNGDFRHGSDRWLMIRDFSHIEWHAKNIYVHTYFEQGLLGIISLFALLITVTVIQLRALARGNKLAPFILSSLGGFMVVGLFGTMIDDPRIALLFFLLAFSGLFNTSPPPATTNNSE